MRAQKPEKVFISAYRKERTPKENQTAHDELACDLALIEGCTFRELEGVYEGQHEACYVVFPNRVAFTNARGGSDIEEHFLDLGALYGQDTILWVHGDDAAELMECRRPRGSAFIGTFQRVNEPEPHEDYTYDDLDGSHYVVR